MEQNQKTTASGMTKIPKANVSPYIPPGISGARFGFKSLAGIGAA
jgi:hypothetical protein